MPDDSNFKGAVGRFQSEIINFAGVFTVAFMSAAQAVENSLVWEFLGLLTGLPVAVVIVALFEAWYLSKEKAVPGEWLEPIRRKFKIFSIAELIWIVIILAVSWILLLAAESQYAWGTVTIGVCGLILAQLVYFFRTNDLNPVGHKFADWAPNWTVLFLIFCIFAGTASSGVAAFISEWGEISYVDFATIISAGAWLLIEVIGIVVTVTEKDVQSRGVNFGKRPGSVRVPSLIKSVFIIFGMILFLVHVAISSEFARANDVQNEELAKVASVKGVKEVKLPSAIILSAGFALQYELVPKSRDKEVNFALKNASFKKVEGEEIDEIKEVLNEAGKPIPGQFQKMLLPSGGNVKVTFSDNFEFNVYCGIWTFWLAVGTSLIGVMIGIYAGIRNFNWKFRIGRRQAKVRRDGNIRLRRLREIVAGEEIARNLELELAGLKLEEALEAAEQSSFDSGSRNSPGRKSSRKLKRDKSQLFDRLSRYRSSSSSNTRSKSSSPARRSRRSQATISSSSDRRRKSRRHEKK